MNVCPPKNINSQPFPLPPLTSLHHSVKFRVNNKFDFKRANKPLAMNSKKANIEYLQRKYAPNKKVHFPSESQPSSRATPAFGSMARWDSSTRIAPSFNITKSSGRSSPSPFEKVNSKKWHPKTLEYMRTHSSDGKNIDPEILYTEPPYSPTFRGQKREISPIRTINPMGIKDGKLPRRVSPKSDNYSEHASRTLTAASNKLTSSASTFDNRSGSKRIVRSPRSPRSPKIEKNVQEMEKKETLEEFYRPLIESFQQPKRPATLQELSPEERAKVGALIVKLAREKEEKERVRKELEARDDMYQRTIDKLKKANEDILHDALEVKDSFKNSLRLLESYKKLAYDLQMTPPRKVIIQNSPLPQSPKQMVEILQRSERRRKYGGKFPEEENSRESRATRMRSEPSTGIRISRSFDKSAIQTEPTKERSPSPPKRLIPIEPGKAIKALLEAQVTEKGTGSTARANRDVKRIEKSPTQRPAAKKQNSLSTQLSSSIRKLSSKPSIKKSTSKTRSVSTSRERIKSSRGRSESRGESRLDSRVSEIGRVPDKSISLIQESNERTLSELRQIKNELHELKQTMQADTMMSPTSNSDQQRITSFNISRGPSQQIFSQQSPQVFPRSPQQISQISRSPQPNKLIIAAPERHFSSPQMSNKKSYLPQPIEKPSRPSSEEDVDIELEAAQKWFEMKKKKLGFLKREAKEVKPEKKKKAVSPKANPVRQIFRSPEDAPRDLQRRQRQAPFFQQEYSPPQMEEITTPKLSTQVDMYMDPGSFRPTNPSVDVYQTSVDQQYPSRDYYHSQESLNKKTSKASIKSSEPISYNISQTHKGSNASDFPREGSDPFVIHSEQQQIQYLPQPERITQPFPPERQTKFRESIESVPRSTVSRVSTLDLNKMSVKDMLELRKVLEEKLSLDRINNNLDNLHHSAQKKLEKIEEMLNLSQEYINQSMHSQPYQQTQEIQGRYTPISGKDFNLTKSQPTKSNERYKAFEASDKLGPPSTIDNSLIKDFESIRGNDTPIAYRQQFEEDIQKIYQQKLNELVEMKEQIMRSKRSEYETMVLEDLRKSAGSSSKDRRIQSPPMRVVQRDSRGASFTKDDLELSDNSNPQSFLFEQRATQKHLEQMREPSPLDSRGKKVQFIREEVSRSKPASSAQNEIDTSSRSLSQDFYDIGLVDLVEDIEKRQQSKKKSGKTTEKKEHHPTKMKSVEDAFGPLFNTVRSMGTARDEFEQEVATVEKGLRRMDKGELQGKGVQWEEDTERYFKHKFLKDSARSGVTSGNGSNRNRKNDSSSLIETDQSIVMIAKKIEDLKREQKRLTEKKPSKERKGKKQEDVTFRKKFQNFEFD